MELGFQDNYFRDALRATEWDGFRHDVSHPAIWELTSARLTRVSKGNSARLGSLIGRVIEEQLAFENAEAGVALFGPYVALEVITNRKINLFDLERPVEMQFVL